MTEGGALPRETYLVHYTKSIDVISSILTKGFLLIPNDRGLMGAFLEDEFFHKNEPQRFGMVSFTQISIQQAAEHRNVFGPYGVAVSWSWARKHEAQRVLYVERNGSLFRTWQFLFQSALRDLRARSDERPDGWWDMSIHNRSMAAIMGSTPWATMLGLYEYMQTDVDAPQVEWRIVQTLPFHFSSDNKEDQIAQALELADSWKVANLTVVPEDIPFLVCPSRDVGELMAQLPDGFESTNLCKYNQKYEQ